MNDVRRMKRARFALCEKARPITIDTNAYQTMDDTEAEYTKRFPTHAILEDLADGELKLCLRTHADVAKFEAMLRRELAISLAECPALIPHGRTLAETLERGSRNLIGAVYASSFGETRAITSRLLKRRMLQLSLQ